MIEVLPHGFGWAEGPAWDLANGRVLLSDLKQNLAHAWSETDGLRTFQKPSGYAGEAPSGGPEPGSNGLAFDAAGRLVLRPHGERRVARLEKGGGCTPLAERFEGH